jgi:DNA mismatch repair ATPase MutS
LDKLFALIDAKGELVASVKRHKLARQHVKLIELKDEYRHIAQFMQGIRGEKALKAKLEDIFAHTQELNLSHIKQTECLQLHEFFELKSFLWQYMQLRETLCQTDLDKLHPMPDMTKLFKLLDPDGNKLPSFRISPLYSKQLAKLLDKQLDLSMRLQLIRQQDLAEAKRVLDMPNLKEEFVLSRNRQEHVSQLLATRHFVVTSENLANYSFKLADSPSALTIKQELESLRTAVTEQETLILQDLSTKVQSSYPELETAYISTGELSWDYSLAEFALNYNCCIPELLPWQDSGFPGISIKAAVNLPLKLQLESSNLNYQPRDFYLDQATNLITGPNMGGKSTALITLGQLCYLASLGIPLPAQEAELPLYESIYCNHNTNDYSENLSSFGKEVVAFNTSLQKKGRILMLLDEFAKGTNPAEGEAICMAVIAYLSTTPHTLVAATHFTAPAAMPGIAHYSIKGIAETDFTRLQNLPEADLKSRLRLLSEAMDFSLIRLQAATPPPQCAVKIATILGLPKAILEHINNAETKR